MQSKYMASFISKLRLSMVSIDNYFRLRVTFSFLVQSPYHPPLHFGVCVNWSLHCHRVKPQRLISDIYCVRASHRSVSLQQRVETFNRMSIQNLNTFDPFADAIKSSEDDVQDGLVHVRIQQRNGRKTLTTVQGLSSEYDLKKIVRACKKEFACNGTVVEHPEYGEVLQLQGDQRENICQWLTKSGLVKPEQLKVHGF